MSDENPKLWLTVRTEDSRPTADEMQYLVETANEALGDKYDILVTTDDIGSISAGEAREVASDIVAALEGDTDE